MLKLSTKQRTFVPTWNGNDKEAERIEVDLIPLTVKDLLAVQVHSGVNLLSGSTVDLSSPENTTKSWEMMVEVLKKYVVAWRGIEIDGEPVTGSEQLLAVIPTDLMGLVAEVFSHVLSSSSGTAGAAKNLPAGYVPASEGSTSVAASAAGKDDKPNDPVTAVRS